MKNVLFKSLIAIILVIAIAFSATSCAISGIVDQVNENVETINRNTNYSEPLGVEGKSTAGDTKLEATEKERNVIGGIETSAEFINYVVKECTADFLYGTTEWSYGIQIKDIFTFATDCIAYDLHDAGYDVFRAVAIVGEEKIPGLAFTKREIYETTEERTIYNCGFVQLTESRVDADIAIVREDVDQGVVVVPYGEYDTSTGFIVSMGVSIPSYSGIYDNYYFRYDQIADYTVSISVQNNDRSIWDESIDLFNFTENKFVFKGDMSYSGTSASPYFSDESKAYTAAREAVDKIIKYQESNAYKAEKQVIIIYTEDVIEEYLLNNSKGTINGFLLEKINDIEVADNQFVVVTSQGVSVETVVDTDALAKERLTNGILGFIGNALLVAGSVFITVATCGAGAPLAVSAICVVAGAGATIYGMSQMIEAGQEIYYGATGDIYSESFNPLLEAFKTAIPDDELATKVYHIFGISCSIVQALVVPANAALTLSRTTGATVWQTTLAITRAVAVEAVKMVVTGVVAAGVGYGTNVIVTDLTDSENWGKVAGFGSALLAGMFTYKGLNKFDAKYNFSGFHSKVYLKVPESEFTKEDVIKQFAEDKWAEMSTYDKKQMLEKLGNSIADDLGIVEKPRIRYYNNSSNNAGYGYFDDHSYTININEYYFNNGKTPGLEMLDTMAHEYRHCWQLKFATGAIKESYSNYISYNSKLGNYDQYRYQPCEADAFDYAEIWTTILKGLI